MHSKLVNLFVFGLSLFFIIGCGEEEKKEEAPIEEVERPDIVVEPSSTDFIVKNRKSKWNYVVGRHISQINLEDFNFFGDFFGGRAKFYHNYHQIVDIGDAQSESIMLGFLDEELCKIKYRLDKDVGPYLIQKLGKCKIKGLDSLTTVRIKQGGFMHVSDSSIALSDDLKYFQLRWVRPDLEAVYKVKRNTDDEPTYSYEERITDYKEAMLFLEKFRNIDLSDKQPVGVP